MTAAKLGRYAAALCLSILMGGAYAAEMPLDLTLPLDTLDNRSFLLADNATQTPLADVNATDSSTKPAFEPRTFSGKKVHQYLGVATAALAGMAFMTHLHPVGDVPRDVNGTHAELGKAAAAMALATVASGLAVHWDDFSLEDGWKDPDNQHVLLGVLGASMMAYAVNKSMNQSSGQANHAGLAEAGMLSMIVAIKLTW